MRRRRKDCPICPSRLRERVDTLLSTTTNLPGAISLVTKELNIPRGSVEKHASHVAADLMDKEDYGPKILHTLDSVLEEASDIIQEARSDQAYAAALNGIKIIGGLLETQAKLLGLLSPHSSKSVHVHLAVPKEEVAKMADDYRTTVLEIGSDDDSE